MILGSQTGQEVRDFGNFRDVDATHRAEQFIAFLDRIEGLPQSVDLRERSYQLLRGLPGEKAVDVGCGTGRAVAELRARGIQALGIDISQQMIETARNRFPDEDFRIADAASLPFEDKTLHLYRAERVYQHLAHPAVALLEAYRVLAPGGRIVLLDPDADMWAIDADNQEMTRALMRALSNVVTSGWIGRRYHSLLLDAGFVDVTIEVKTGIFTDYAHTPILPGMANAGVAAGILTQQEADGWLAEQKRRTQEGRFLLAMPIFLASARRP